MRRGSLRVLMELGAVVVAAVVVGLLFSRGQADRHSQAAASPRPSSTSASAPATPEARRVDGRVSLYATGLSPADLAEIGRRLNEWSVPYTVEEGRLLVEPSQRQVLVSRLLEHGLPHRSAVRATGRGETAPGTIAEKKQAAYDLLTSQLVDMLRQFDPVADAYVNLVPANDDLSTDGPVKAPRALIMLKLKHGAALNAPQVEAMQNLLAGSVEGLEPRNVIVTDSRGVKYTDDQGRVVIPSPASPRIR